MAEPVDPQWVQEILLMAKESGASRVKVIGFLEVEFAQPAAEAPQTEYVQVPVQTPVTEPSTPAPRRGYGALFGGDMPKFEKPKA